MIGIKTKKDMIDRAIDFLNSKLKNQNKLMAKEWILNSAINRWGLQKKRKVGAVSEEIRKCSPKDVKDWEEYYFKNVYPKKHL